MTLEQKLELTGAILGVSKTDLSFLQIDDSLDCIYQSIRGGGSVLVDVNGDYLFFPSSTSRDVALSDFKNGKRSPRLFGNPTL